MITEEEWLRRASVDPKIRKYWLDAGRSSFEGITLFPPESETFTPIVRTPQEQWALAGKSVARSWLEVGNALRRAMGMEEVTPEELEMELEAEEGGLETQEKE